MLVHIQVHNKNERRVNALLPASLPPGPAMTSASRGVDPSIPLRLPMDDSDAHRLVQLHSPDIVTID
jgi:hypothetical protein